jgi:glycosyltransferase involved in cell wall biosynthesis
MAELAQTVLSPVESRLAAQRRIAIVPALNEQETIARVIDEIRAFDSGFEILVVDDGSSDRAAAVAEARGAHVLALPFNLGIGGALQTGYLYARDDGFELAVQLDGDGQHNPHEVARLVGRSSTGRRTWSARASSRVAATGAPTCVA